MVTKGEGFMIIDIRDLPEGVKLKSIDCKILFDDTVSVVNTTVSTVAKPSAVHISTPASEAQGARPEKIATEMQDLKF